MEVREVFARNLRNLCETQPSIASVCRDIDINRQQFARYLSGKGLPNTGNLEKICEYFGIVEAELFRSDLLMPPAEKDVGNHAFGKRVMDVLQQQPPARIDPGLYFIDYAGPSLNNSIVRSVMIVEVVRNVPTFRRLTGFGERRNSWWRQFDGDHEGVILERRGNFYFMGINTKGSREPSMLVLRFAQTERFVLVGHASIIGVEGPEVMAAVLSAAPKSMTLRGALKNARSHAVDTPSIPIDVVDLLEHEAAMMRQNPGSLAQLAAAS